jgi:hypothetical protein
MTVDSTINSTEDSNTLNNGRKKIAAKAEKRWGEELLKKEKIKEEFVATCDYNEGFGSQIGGNILLGWHKNRQSTRQSTDFPLEPMQFVCSITSVSATNLGLRRNWARRQRQSRIA